MRKLNSLVNVRDDKLYILVFLKRLSKECIPARSFLLILYICYLCFREKHGLVRNDFLDCLMELRQADKDEVQGDVQSADNANIGATYSKLQLRVILQVQETNDIIVLGVCFVVHKCLEFGPEIFEFLTAISLGSGQDYIETMKWLAVVVNSDHTSSVTVLYFNER